MLEILAAILENGDQGKFRRISKSNCFFQGDNNKYYYIDKNIIQIEACYIHVYHLSI